MEIILAIVVGLAVIFFGALISMGNERQRKSIDNLREQVVLWAMQDLRLKRERLARDVHVDDPLGWLIKVAGKVSGLDTNLQIIDYFDEPHALLCMSGNQDTNILFSLMSPKEIKRFKREQRSRLSQFGKNNPLLSLPRGASVYEISVLNSGILFDLELHLAWKGLTGQNIEQSERLWMYMI
jgi:hypothetical protein